jgi:hypothetical protein
MEQKEYNPIYFMAGGILIIIAKVCLWWISRKSNQKLIDKDS